MNYRKYFCFEEGAEVFGERGSQLLGLRMQKAKGNQTGGLIYLLYSETVVRITEPDPEILAQLWRCLCEPPDTTTFLPRSAGQKVEKLPYKETQAETSQKQPPSGPNQPG